MNIGIIKANNLLAGQHFFERATMRFFQSRVFSTVYGGKYFITSEINPSGEKRYTVREAVDGGKRIKTHGFFAYRTLSDAKDQARLFALVEGERVWYEPRKPRIEW